MISLLETKKLSLPDIRFAEPIGVQLDKEFENLLPDWQPDRADWLLDENLAYHSEHRQMEAILDREDAIEQGSNIYWGKVIVKQKRWINSSGQEYRRMTIITPTNDSYCRPSRYRMGPFYARQ